MVVTKSFLMDTKNDKYGKGLDSRIFQTNNNSTDLSLFNTCARRINPVELFYHTKRSSIISSFIKTYLSSHNEVQFQGTG